MDSSSSVNIIICIISSRVKWLTLNLNWNILTIRVNTIKGITSIISFALNIPHKASTIRKTVMIPISRASILGHNYRIFKFLGTFKTSRKITCNKLLLKEPSTLCRNNFIWHILSINCKLEIVVDWVLKDCVIIIILREHNTYAGGIADWHVNSRLNSSSCSSNWESIIIQLLAWNNLWSIKQLPDLSK